MQNQLDLYRTHMNQRRPRANKKKLLPHGIPDLIFENPEEYGSQQYIVSISTLHPGWP